MSGEPRDIPGSSTALEASNRSTERELKARTRRSFLVSAFTAAAAYGTWRWIKNSPEVDGIPRPLRRVLGWNEDVSVRLFDSRRTVRELPKSEITGGGPRVNGDIGLEHPLDADSWRLRIGGDVSLTLDEIKTLPEVSQITPLHCIEGWTTVALWTGVRFVDFTKKFFPQGMTMPFVGLSTPKNEYYVGLDAPSAFHPQTLLCYAINGLPLSAAHGAPLRLLIPTKYGIKNLKRVGNIHFVQSRPADYWAEQGYDWFAGF